MVVVVVGHLGIESRVGLETALLIGTSGQARISRGFVYLTTLAKITLGDGLHGKLATIYGVSR